MPRKASRKVQTQVPKVPKQPLVLHQPPDTTMESPSEDTLELQLLEGMPIAKDSPVKPAMAIEGMEGLSLHRRPFVPLPPICSDSTVHTEETTSRPSDTAVHISPEHPSDEDTKSTESIFLTQVSGMSYSLLHKDDSEVDKDQRPSPSSPAPKEMKKTQRRPPPATHSSKYRGYEELLTAKPDPDFIEPKGIQKNAQALQHMLKHPLLYASSRPKLGTPQKHYVPKEKRVNLHCTEHTHPRRPHGHTVAVTSRPKGHASLPLAVIL